MQESKTNFDKPNLTPKELMAYLNISESTLWRFQKNPEFPKPRRLTARTLLFLKNEVDEYLQSKGVNNEIL